MELHQKKMNQIAVSNKAQKEAVRINKQLKRKKEERKRNAEFLNNEKNISINKDNQLLLNKLVEISSGKFTSVQPAPRREKQRRNKSLMKVHTSLNMPFRKRENERIEKENHEIAKRLFDKQASLNKKSMDVEWQNYRRY